MGPWALQMAVYRKEMTLVTRYVLACEKESLNSRHRDLPVLLVKLAD